MAYVSTAQNWVMEFKAEWAELEKLMSDTEKLSRLYGSKTAKVRELNVKAAKAGVDAYKSAVQVGGKVRVRRKGPSSARYQGGKKGPAQDIMPGTLKRSIKVIKPRDGSNVWLGPKSTATFKRGAFRQTNRSDAWFSDIVEQGRERFGPGKNRGFAEKGMARARKAILPILKKGHTRFIQKHW